MTRRDTSAKAVSEHITELYGIIMNLPYFSYLRTWCTVAFVQLYDVISVGPSNTKIPYVSIYLGVNIIVTSSQPHIRDPGLWGSISTVQLTG